MKELEKNVEVRRQRELAVQKEVPEFAGGGMINCCFRS